MTTDWQPCASLDIIRQRAEFYKTIRRFMEERDIMEVHTPIMSRFGNTDPNLASIKTLFHSPAEKKPVTCYLNTSPEFAMKRLLVAGSGPIYQICKVFRDNEYGPLHQPEFTMLEWYRVGYDHHQLMDELADLLSRLGYYEIDRKSYSEVFNTYTGLDPHTADTDTLRELAISDGFISDTNDQAVLLDFIFSHRIAPALVGNSAIMVYDFPACQASLARIREDQVAVAERFELFIDGVEIANGFHELSDAKEQLTRFQSDNQKRKSTGLEEIPIDKNLISSLENGLPDCSGVAVGLDRLFMKMKGLSRLEEILTFSSFRA